MQNNEAEAEMNAVRAELADMQARIKRAEDNGQFDTIWHTTAERLKKAVDKYERAEARAAANSQGMPAVRPARKHESMED